MIHLVGLIGPIRSSLNPYDDNHPIWYQRNVAGQDLSGGSVEKCLRACAGAASRLRAEALRRASVRAGRPLAVLTYSLVCSAHPSGCGLPFERPQGRTGRAPSARLRACFLNTPLFFFVWPSVIHMWTTGKILQLFNSPR